MRAQKGFTLVELVVVIAILGVLAAITVPRVNQFLQQATEQSYEADLAIVQSAVSAWYSDLHNEQFLGSRQFPIIGRDETGQEGRIVRGEEGVEGVDAIGPFDHKDDGFPLAPSDAAGPDWNPLGGSQGLICCTWAKTARQHGKTMETESEVRARILGRPLRLTIAAIPTG